ncbi:Hypothetical protein AA314_06871 [Archangium gephyra]|uniref:Uncharacterized protein n=1 Tax=Archangium gephyra TaxID=48 RepID=A0AAC8QCM8_9BACT|nr:Hypothetical protein AA314_06871 [Archangium gephyra]
MRSTRRSAHLKRSPRPLGHASTRQASLFSFVWMPRAQLRAYDP